MYCFTSIVLEPDSLCLNFQTLLTPESIRHVILFVSAKQLETLMKQSFLSVRFFSCSRVLSNKQGTS